MTIKKDPANRLAGESSTYLLQHAQNPVHWFPWSEEALSEAFQQDKPILLSIGYSACHWCHVMEEESFEDQETSEIINENFIAIKVDREERPDIDDIYMTAVQLMAGHGGWPLTVFLTPKLKPFYGGTYFPKENKQYGQQIMPGFKTILKAVHRAWMDQRDEVEKNAEHLTDAINSISRQVAADEQKSTDNSKDLVVESGLQLLSQFDKKWGGFGRAPKFPQAMCLFLCLRLAFRLKQTNDERHKMFFEALSTTLNRMASGGIYDHLGGGFARYSTDEKWLVPHFEKMLYDNALLAHLYLESFAFSGNEYWREIGCQTLDFIERELSIENGAFYSSLDADSEGEEGKFYLWRKSEIVHVLGEQSETFCQMFSVTEQGNFEDGQNILYTHGPERNADLMKQKLFAYRAKRIRPGLDDKILVSWNGLAISAFVSGYKLTGQEKYLKKAKDAGHFILSNLYSNGRLMHVYAGGQSKFFGYLDDYAFFMQALIDLAGIDDDPLWLETASELGQSILAHFYDEKEADFFYTADDHEKLIARTKNSNDGPLPSATSVVISNLIKLAAITDEERYRKYAITVLNKYKSFLYRSPGQYANMAAAWDSYLCGTWAFIVALAGDPLLDRPLLQAVHSQYLPDKMVLVKNGGLNRAPDRFLTIFSGKSLLNGQPAVYVCNEQGCQPPISDAESFQLAFKQLLKRP